MKGARFRALTHERHKTNVAIIPVEMKWVRFRAVSPLSRELLLSEFLFRAFLVEMKGARFRALTRLSGFSGLSGLSVEMKGARFRALTQFAVFLFRYRLIVEMKGARFRALTQTKKLLVIISSG